MVAVRWRLAALLTAVYSDEDPHISRECDADRVSHYHATCRLDASHAWFVRQENAAVVDVHHGVAFHPILKAASSAVHNEMRYLDGHNFRIAADDTNIREVKASCCDDGSYAGVLNFTFVREPVERFLSAYHFLAEHSRLVCDKLAAEAVQHGFCPLLKAIPKTGFTPLLGEDMVERPPMQGDDDTAYGLFESFLEICELWGWIGPSRFFNAHLLPQALQLTEADGAPRRSLQHVRLLPGAAAVQSPAKRARNMSDQLLELYGAACPGGGCVFREPSADKPDWAGMHLSPNRWFSVTAAKLPDRLLVRACKLVLVDYCCFDVVLPAACAAAGLSCADATRRSRPSRSSRPRPRRTARRRRASRPAAPPARSTAPTTTTGPTCPRSTRPSRSSRTPTTITSKLKLVQCVVPDLSRPRPSPGGEISCPSPGGSYDPRPGVRERHRRLVPGVVRRRTSCPGRRSRRSTARVWSLWTRSPGVARDPHPRDSGRRSDRLGKNARRADRPARAADDGEPRGA